MKTYNKTIILLLTLVILFLKTTAIKGIESKDSLYVIGNDYFEIICYEKNDYASDIEKSILKKYHRLLEDYEIQKMDKVTIRIYPSLAQFHEAVNMQGASNWVVATAWGNKEIRMTAPTAQGIPITYKDMTEKLPVHEFTHCLVMNFIDPSQIPIW
ncbi:MAG: hypothetical protein MUP85_17685, partial [Candidatus Lokiarchaeota archaeon]|nr:hypothetical protein [Candidatus Lokiarchaeota archaeon]